MKELMVVENFVRNVILFVFQSFRENYQYAEALDAISTVGLSISILGLVITIIHHIREK